MFNFFNLSPPPAADIKETGVTPIKKMTSDLVQQRALAFGDDLTSPTPITSPSTTSAGKCVSCDLLIHRVERVSVDGNVFHKNCLRCGVLNSRQDVVGCNRLLPPTPDNYIVWGGVPYCKACHSKYFHHGQIKNTLGRVVDIKPDDGTLTSDKSSLNAGNNTYVPEKIQEAEQRVSRNCSRDNSPYRDRRELPIPVSPGMLVDKSDRSLTTPSQGPLINHKYDGAMTPNRNNSMEASSGTTAVAAPPSVAPPSPPRLPPPPPPPPAAPATPSIVNVPNPHTPISTSSTDLIHNPIPMPMNGSNPSSIIEPYWTEPYNPHAPTEVVLDDLNSLIQNLLLQVDYSARQDPRNLNNKSDTTHQTNEVMDNHSQLVMTSQEREALLNSIQNIDRLIAALSFPLPLTETSKPNGQEVVNDLVAFLSLLKIQPRIRER